MSHISLTERVPVTGGSAVPRFIGAAWCWARLCVAYQARVAFQASMSACRNDVGAPQRPCAQVRNWTAALNWRQRWAVGRSGPQQG
jgi:hypothetical protein